MPTHIVEMAKPKAISVRAQYELLKQILKEPEAFEKPLREVLLSALTSQGSMAALELPEYNLVAMSLNTHKAIANEELEGGYDALNAYRRAVLEKLKAFGQQSEEPGRGTINWYKTELAEKSEKLARVANDVALMSQQLDEVLALAQELAIEAGKEAEFHKRRSELVRKFKLR